MPRGKLTLISHPLCPFVQRAAILLLEKGAPFERIDVDLAAKPDWFLALSPTGKVPSINIGVQGTRRDQGVSEEIAMHLMTDVRKIFGIGEPPPKEF